MQQMITCSSALDSVWSLNGAVRSTQTTGMEACGVAGQCCTQHGVKSLWSSLPASALCWMFVMSSSVSLSPPGVWTSEPINTYPISRDSNSFATNGRLLLNCMCSGAVPLISLIIVYILYRFQELRYMTSFLSTFEIHEFSKYIHGTVTASLKSLNFKYFELINVSETSHPRIPRHGYDHYKKSSTFSSLSYSVHNSKVTTAQQLKSIWSLTIAICRSVFSQPDL